MLFCLRFFHARVMVNAMKAPSVKGLHLWAVHFADSGDATILWVTTRWNRPVQALRKGLDAAEKREDCIHFDKLIYEGTIDA